jgi:kynureninase
VIDELSFPSDRYAVTSQLLLKGQPVNHALQTIKSEDGRFLDEQDIIAAMRDDVAVIFLPSVLYRSGQLLNMAYLTQQAHKRNILIGFDCAHSVGAIPHALSDWQVDFACWCNYKHCNAGPGAVAGLYINERHFDKKPALSGWFGYKKEKQFDMLPDFENAQNAAGWQIGTPHILSMAPLEGSLKIFNDAGIEAIREKSLMLTSYLIFLIDTVLDNFSFYIGSPREEKSRGGHIALEHENALQINAALKNRSIITDFRYPNIIRMAPAALYNSFDDVWRTVQALKEVMIRKEYENYPDQRDPVA